MLYKMNQAFDKHYDAAYDQQKTLTSKLSEIEKKVEELEEDYYVEKKIPDETYSRLRAKLANEKKKIEKKINT